MKLTPRLLRYGLNIWPPFLFTGIHVTHLSEDWRHARVELRLRPWNRNYIGTQFGGSLFSMTDPFWMLLMLHALPRDYIVWDKAGEIEFVKPGRGTVYAEFRLDDAQVTEVMAAAAGGEKVLRWFQTDVIDAKGEIIARVRKQLYVRLKREIAPAPTAGG
ncbi:DUF4442 domain-containing protein [Lysobacter pythonis]|uniref:DUF4442 domain-containing protein n=1 Tax=Solilutibacter pythonis TaxID=2483112 RepID=A0A3M2HUT1_9GAMM|nr:DUF4442 domain-containing protein [Lysobacter pythonis]RMH91169.1 DUF4442 domain-containing protein [Lysobacter pythonis]